MIWRFEFEWTGYLSGSKVLLIADERHYGKCRSQFLPKTQDIFASDAVIVLIICFDPSMVINTGWWKWNAKLLESAFHFQLSVFVRFFFGKPECILLNEPIWCNPMWYAEICYITCTNISTEYVYS